MWLVVPHTPLIFKKKPALFRSIWVQDDKVIEQVVEHMGGLVRRLFSSYRSTQNH